MKSNFVQFEIYSVFLQAVNTGELKIIPDMFVKTWRQWLEDSRLHIYYTLTFVGYLGIMQVWRLPELFKSFLALLNAVDLSQVLRRSRLALVQTTNGL